MIKVDVGLNAKGRPCRIFVTFDKNDWVHKKATNPNEQHLHLSCRGAMDLIQGLTKAMYQILW